VTIPIFAEIVKRNHKIHYSQEIQMKPTSWLTTIAIAGFLAVSAPIVLPTINSTSLQAFAQDTMGQSEIAKIAALKGKPESAKLMREFYKDLTPIGIQPGGAGMVVNLYSKKHDTTLSLCTTFDVVVAVKKGKIAKFPPAEVK
jgi:hypothetical protein